MQLNLDAHGKIAWVNSLGNLNNGRAVSSRGEWQKAFYIPENVTGQRTREIKRADQRL